jgi:hypothetical protein
MKNRNYAPSLSPVERPDVDDGSREELAEYYAVMERQAEQTNPVAQPKEPTHAAQ